MGFSSHMLTHSSFMSYVHGLWNVDQTNHMSCFALFLFLSSYIFFCLDMYILFVFHQMQWMMMNKCLYITIASIKFWVCLCAQKQKYWQPKCVLSVLPFQRRKHLTTTTTLQIKLYTHFQSYSKCWFKLKDKCVCIDPPSENEWVCTRKPLSAPLRWIRISLCVYVFFFFFCSRSKHSIYSNVRALNI